MAVQIKPFIITDEMIKENEALIVEFLKKFQTEENNILTYYIPIDFHKDMSLLMKVYEKILIDVNINKVYKNGLEIKNNTYGACVVVDINSIFKAFYFKPTGSFYKQYAENKPLQKHMCLCNNLIEALYLAIVYYLQIANQDPNFPYN